MNNSVNCAVQVEAPRRADNLPSGLGYLAPGNEVNFLVLKKFPPSRSGEEVEIALTPGCAPGVALAGGGFHFVISERKVYDKFGDTGLKVFEGDGVEVGPFVGRDAGGDGDGVVNDDIVRTEVGLEIRTFWKPVPRDKEGEFVFVGQAQCYLKQLRTVLVETILMGVEVGGMDAHVISAVDLCSEFDFGLLGVDAGGGGPIVEKIAVGIKQGRDEITGSDGAPAVVNTLASEGEVETKIDGGMRFCVVCDFGKPRAGNHDAGGIDQTSLKRLSGGGVN